MKSLTRSVQDDIGYALRTTLAEPIARCTQFPSESIYAAPQSEMDRVRRRLKQLRNELKNAEKRSS
jgi:hypothetical protein